jgi:hypothetical protein
VDDENDVTREETWSKAREATADETQQRVIEALEHRE